jgi:hypothetical protein
MPVDTGVRFGHTLCCMKKTIALILAFAGAPIAANAQAAPITVKDCSVLQYIRTATRPFWYPWGPYPRGPYGSPYTDGIHISYANTSTKTATRVAFLVNYRGDVEHVADAGTFSPGVTIDHTFSAFSGLAWLGPNPNSCRPVAVRYSDGTVWRASGFPIRQATH